MTHRAVRHILVLIVVTVIPPRAEIQGSGTHSYQDQSVFRSTSRAVYGNICVVS